MKNKRLYILGLLLCCCFIRDLQAQAYSLILLPGTDGIPSTVLIQKVENKDKEVQLRLRMTRNGSRFANKAYDLTLEKSQTRVPIRADLDELGYGQQIGDIETNWELCMELWDLEVNQKQETCQALNTAPILPPHLVYPFDEDQIESPLPILSWTSPAAGAL